MMRVLLMVLTCSFCWSVWLNTMVLLWNIHCIFFYILEYINYILWQGYQSLQVYRVAHALWSQGRKVLALALQSRVSEVVFGKKWRKLHKVISYSFCWWSNSLLSVQVFGVDIHPGMLGRRLHANKDTLV